MWLLIATIHSYFPKQALDHVVTETDKVNNLT